MVLRVIGLQNKLRIVVLTCCLVHLAEAAATRRGGALEMQGIDHLGMNVPDIDQAVAFFGELLGTRTVLDMHPASADSDWKKRFSWNESSQLERILMLRTASGEQLELFQYSGPQISTRQPHEDDAAATHIALRVKDIDAAMAVIRKYGLKVLCDPVTNDDGMRWFYFLTPWGSQLEIVSRPARRTSKAQ